MPDKKEIIIFVLLCLIALGLGYWYGMPDKPSQQSAGVGTPPAPTVVTNVVTNVLKEVVTNIVAANPQPTPAPVKPRPQPTPVNSNPSLNAEESAKVIEAAIRKAARKPTGELTTADFEKVTELNLTSEQLTDVPKGLEKLTQLTYLDLYNNQLTDVKGLEKLTQLKWLTLFENKLTDVKGLEKLTKLEGLWLYNNYDLPNAKIYKLQQALPRCVIYSNAIQ